MKHKVELSQRAQSDLRQAYDYIRTGAPENGLRWLNQIEERILTLGHFPERHAISSEGQYLGRPVRQMVHGNYRVLYIVREASVLVLTVRHAARHFAKRDELTPDL